MRILQRLIRNRLGLGLLAVHFLCGCLVVGEMPRSNEVHCSEAIISSFVDGELAGRHFYFNYSSALAEILLLIDLPALVLGCFLTDLVAIAHDRLPYVDLSWIRAIAFLLTTSIQWLMVGQLLRISGSALFAKRLKA